MKRNTILIFSIAALTLAACGDDDGGRTGGDADGSTDSSTDAPLNEDDASVQDDGSQQVDNRTRQCGMSQTLTEFVNTAMCETDTKGCLEACGSDLEGCIEEAETQQDQQACIMEAQTCETACFDADETVTTLQTQDGPMMFGCDDCILYEQIDCIYNNGCDEEFADFQCCAFDAGCLNVPADQQQTCVQQNCSAQGQAYQVCSQQAAQSCTTALDACFSGGAEGDAGTGDGGAEDAGADAGL